MPLPSCGVLSCHALPQARVQRDHRPVQFDAIAAITLAGCQPLATSCSTSALVLGSVDVTTSAARATKQIGMSIIPK
eukprot:COSAG06_NODE_24954_length_648_cov_1.428051_1_plen_76_part_10